MIQEEVKSQNQNRLHTKINTTLRHGISKYTDVLQTTLRYEGVAVTSVNQRTRRNYTPHMTRCDIYYTSICNKADLGKYHHVNVRK